MRANRLYLLFLFVFILCNDPGVSAQIMSSPYSIFGLGSTEGNVSGVSSAMGGAGIALLSGQTLSLRNPASTAGMDSLVSVFEVGFAGKYTSYTTTRYGQSMFDANFRYVALAFRLNKKWALAGGITPYSTIGYNINVMTDLGGSDIQYKKSFSGDGGINRVFLSNSFKITKNLSVGVNPSFLFGSITHSESSADFKYALVDKVYVSNMQFDYGLNYRIKLNNWNYFLGFVYNNGKTLRTTKVSTIVTSTSSETTKSPVNELKIPQSFGFGLAFQKDFVRGAIDWETAKWNDLEFSNRLLRARNSNKYSAGLEIPSWGNRKGTGRMIFYRLGAQYSESYMVIDNNPINYRSVSLGAGIPAKGYHNVINLAIELGQNGTKNGGLFKESFLVLHVDLSFRDLWFVKRRYF